MSCKAFPAGPAPTQGNAILSLGGIHRWGSSAMMPGALPRPYSCRAATKRHARGRTRWDHPHTLPSGCAGEKSRNTGKREKHGAFNRLPSPDSGGTRIVGSTAKSTCRAACTQAGRCRACSHHCCGMASKGQHVPVFLSALSDVHSHPSQVRSAGSLSHHVCTLCDSSVARAFMLYCYTVKTVKVFCWDNSQYKALPENPQAKATLNNKREFRVHKTSLRC